MCRGVCKGSVASEIVVGMDALSKLTKDELSEWLEQRKIPQDVIEEFRGNKEVYLFCEVCLPNILALAFSLVWPGPKSARGVYR